MEKIYKPNYIPLILATLGFNAVGGIFIYFLISDLILENISAQPIGMIIVMFAFILSMSFLTVFYPLYILYTYYLNDRYITLSVDKPNRKFIYKNKNETIAYNFDDIRYSIDYQPSARVAGGYYEIYMNDGKIIHISCMICTNIKKMFDKNLLVRKEFVFNITLPIRKK